MGRLDTKVVLVTGAARGTGAVVAARLVAEGATVVAADVRDDDGQAAAARSGASYCHLDVTDEAQWTAAVTGIERDHGGLDVLVNNAALLHLAEIEHTPVDAYERLWRVNELGTFLGIRAAIDPMRRRGGGSIINISSIDGLFASALTGAYSATKFAVRGLTKVAALELGRFHIKVNAICPAAGNPQMVSEALSPELLGSLGGATKLPDHPPIGRHGMSEDVAGAVVFLASDDSAFCTGTDLTLDGGTSAGMFAL